MTRPLVDRFRGWSLAEKAIAAAVVLVIAGTVVAWVRIAQTDGRRTAERDAVRTAAESIDRLLTFEPATVLQDAKREKRLLTGDFADEYERDLTTRWGPQAVEQKVSTTVAVREKGLISASSDRAQVLVFANLTRKVGTTGDTEVIGARMQVTMRKVDGEWRISAYKGL